MGEAGVKATSLSLDISALVRKRKTTLKRLTAPGSDEKNADFVTWAGQAWTNGTAVGKEVTEAVHDGKIELRGSDRSCVDQFVDFLEFGPPQLSRIKLTTAFC
jgi:hypothetical protein